VSYPIDPDVDLVEDAPHHPGAVHEPGPRPPWPRIVPSVVGLVFAGGCLGGYVRYAVTSAWTSPANAFPWATLLVNTVGAFVLGAVVVVAARGPRSPRPLVGTGFCGGLTTFSAVVVSADRLGAHGHLGAAIGYVAATTVTGVAAAWAGLRLAAR
jgi:fluoride exporter